MARGDLFILATGRDPHLSIEYPPSEAECRRRVKQWKEQKVDEDWDVLYAKPDSVLVSFGQKKDACAYYVFDPQTYQQRWKGTLIHRRLNPEYRPEA